jgi:hypothetical protein
LHTMLIGFSVVKFQAMTGNDSLVVFIFESDDVPPGLTGRGTYKVNLGDAGFPSPNIRFDHPLEAAARDVLAVSIDPPITFAPRRDFIVGVKIISKQKLAVGQGTWNGLSMLINPNQPEFERSRRYAIAPQEIHNRNDLATQGAEAALFMRAIVGYDPDMEDDDLTDVRPEPVAQGLELAQNFPNPFNPSTVLRYTVDQRRHIRLSVHDVLGRELRVLADGMMDAGQQQVVFNAAGLPGGMYLARLSTGDQVLSRKMLLLK